jgi:hypothetical protein
MPTTKRIAVAPTRVLLIVSLLVGCRTDRAEWFYPSLADVKRAEPSAQSWVPDDILPTTSRNIHIAGEISPSNEWCTFEFSPLDSETLVKTLSKVDTLPQAVSNVPNPRKSWWPSTLTGNLDVELLRKSGQKLLVTEKPANAVNTTIYLFALDPQKGRGYFYATYKR